MNTIYARRLGALTAGALAAGVLALAPTGAAVAATTPSPSSAGTWLKGELVDGLVPSQYGGGDYGLSIDAAFTALSVGDTATAATIRDAVAAQLPSYITGEDFGDTGSTYANATAKALVLAERTGGNPRSFGGIDLVARLESVVQPSGGLRDVSTYGDNANTLGQAFAVEGLTVAGSSKAASTRGFLLAQQCGAGFFRLDFDSETDRSCATASAHGASVDATGLAVTALVGGDAASTTATAKAVTWLTGVQQADGSFSPDGTTPGINANATGLAGQAFGATCALAAANRAAAAVRGLQVPATSATVADRGAIALDAADRAAAQTGGISTEPAVRDRYRRATAQAAPALTSDPQAPATVTLTAPRDVAAGSAQVLTIAGAAKGETVCLTTPTGTTRLVGTGSPLSVPVTAPATGSAAYAATTGPGSATASLTVGVSARTNGTKFARGAKVKVKLTGLTTGQKIVVKVRGQKVKKTKADGTTDKVTFRVPRSLKPGKATIKITSGGQVEKIKVRIKR